MGLALVTCSQVLAAGAEDGSIGDVVGPHLLRFFGLGEAVGAEAQESVVAQQCARLRRVAVVLAQVDADSGNGGSQVHVVVDQQLRAGAGAQLRKGAQDRQLLLVLGAFHA